MMSSDSVCRVCLEGNLKLSPTKSIPLLNVYERITNTQFNKDERPNGFCPFCYQKLLKCYTFFTMAWRAENLFDQLVLQGVKEFVTKLKLGVTQHMTMAPMQSVTINSLTGYGLIPEETIKEEPSDPKTDPEPVAIEENVVVKSEAVCRVCLAGNLTLNPMENLQLLEIYKKLTSIQFNSEDGRPRAVCPFCYQKLLKCYTFSKIACRSEKLFDQLLRNGLKEISNELVTKLALRVKQPLAVAHAQSLTIDSRTYLPLKQTVKKEPIQVQDEYTEENQTGNSGVIILEECIKFIKQKPPARFLCSICGKQYDSETILEKHMKIHTKEKYKCNVCNKELVNKYCLVNHMRCHSDIKEFVCTVCNKQFRFKHHLLQHMRTHTGEQPYPCTVCQRRFNEKSKLTRHMLLHTGRKDIMGQDMTLHTKHSEDMLFSCKECNKKFPNNHTLIRHMLVHTGEKPFPCSVCDKRYQTKYNLAVHMKLHNRDILSFTCHLCQKQIRYRSHLLAHLRQHNVREFNEMPPSKIFQCSVCYERCVPKKNLITHMRLLHPGQKLYACNDCDKQYDIRYNLIKHMRVHSGKQFSGKQYSCDLCDTKYSYKNSLKDHMRVHTGEKPYYCTICKKRFTQRHMLKIHIKNKHKVKSESHSE